VLAARSGWLIRCAAAALTTGVVVLLAAAVARADGDPASDYLLMQPVFFPFRPAPKPLEQKLSGLVRSANAQGLQVRVAIIQSRHDLGSIPELFGRPDVYARFLSAEIHSAWTHRVLVVMPNGYGIAAGAQIQSGGGTGHVSGGVSRADRAVLARLPPPHGATSAAVVKGAIGALDALAARHDVHLTLPSQPTSASISSKPAVPRLVTGAVAAMIGLVAGLCWYAFRTRPRHP
jgi:hypothetical protein